MTDATTVCVTGASGFIGSRIVENLLDAGYHVRGTVRNPNDSEKYGFLYELDGADERLTLHRGQLMESGSFEDAIEGSEFVVHTASPVAIDVAHPEKDLVEPAVFGTRNVLRSCERSSSVRRVVLTSSMAAVTDERGHDHVLDESDWNETSTLDRNPYFLSKTMAEKAAWDIAEGADFELVVINPDIVAGPALSPSMNTSRQMFLDMLEGEFPVIMDLTWAVVDVRDVAEAHRRALEAEDAAGRHICVEHTIEMKDLVAFLRDEGYGAYSLPKIPLNCSVGTLVVRALTLLEEPGTRTYMQTHLGGGIRFDNAKIRESLSMEFRPLEQTLRDTYTDLERWGHIARDAR